jgi:hypothetical protein
MSDRRTVAQRLDADRAHKNVKIQAAYEKGYREGLLRAADMLDDVEWTLADGTPVHVPLWVAAEIRAEAVGP